MNWYILRTFAKKENKVKQELEKIIQRENLDHLIEDIQIPTENVISMSGKNKKVKEKILYSGYVFVKTTINRQVLDLVRDLKDSTGFLALSRTDKTPIPLSPDEVRTILKYKEEKENPPRPEFDFKVGDFVQVTSGPLKGYQGRLGEIYQEKLRGMVELSIFGRLTSTEVDLGDMELIK